MSAPEFIVLYRWRLRPGYESEFEEAWSIVTRALIERGSMGSRLHRGDDGIWYAYAQWPSEAVRARANVQAPEVDGARRAMRAAVSEEFPEVTLTPSIDHLLSSQPVTRMRVARPTADLDGAIAFWTRVVGFELLSRFTGHDGYDGAILGNSETRWELEVTQHSSGFPLPSPTEEDILALYLSRSVAEAITDRLRQAGHLPHDHQNPYWKKVGASVHLDPDGYTLVVFPLD